MSFNRIDDNNNEKPNDPHKILIYGYSDQDMIKFEDSFKNVGENDFIFLNNSNLNQKVYDIIISNNMSENNTSNEDFPNIPFILLSGFSNKEVMDFFNFIKENNFPKPLIALLTKTNKSWFLKDLIKDVYQEHMIMINKK
ncbi:DUF3783 domain-containing protein [Tepidibacter hydrothermalis]|uniref:DUF3783 domain-containing protein n=1 Tax=Tepidibacter hydrothermalis TaxID=3036126 RepID=A0ABY8EDL2_9FIRM|nr:DUF3783 domain-containing protein [Tepidibacter hydrothermalis]WFD09582.1 DUF3783 domain-containing protein [Tepidibacter hydrothermalis]